MKKVSDYLAHSELSLVAATRTYKQDKANATSFAGRLQAQLNAPTHTNFMIRSKK